MFVICWGHVDFSCRTRRHYAAESTYTRDTTIVVLLTHLHCAPEPCQARPLLSSKDGSAPASHLTARVSATAANQGSRNRSCYHREAKRRGPSGVAMATWLHSRCQRPRLTEDSKQRKHNIAACQRTASARRTAPQMSGVCKIEAAANDPRITPP